MKEMPHIAVFTTTAHHTLDNILRGFLSYLRTHSYWSVDLKTGRNDEKKLEDVDWTSYDGAIIHHESAIGVVPVLLKQIRTRWFPVIFISDHCRSFDSEPCSVLTCDNASIADTAAAHLISKHCNAYAFVHAARQPWSNARGRLFAEAIKAKGERFLWRASEQKTLVRLIADAPKPLGIFAATDMLARATLDVCHHAGCSVPDNVLILGVDNDETICAMSRPALSSIPLSSYDAGYRAAAILDGVLRGEISSKDMPDIFYTGDHVIERLSTAHSFAYDMLVRRCREVLAQDFTTPIRVSALATSFRVSRRTLETHFRAVTGTTIAEEVIRLRIERAKHLLSTTVKTLTQIADECGFYDISHFSAMFLRHVGIRPTVFRNNNH